MSEERIIPDAAEFASAASKATVFWTNVFQSLLVAVVVLWVLDIPRQVFNVSFYTEQMLTVCLGLTLALALHCRNDAAAALERLGCGCCCRSVLCGYIAARYETLTDRRALISARRPDRQRHPVLLILEASRRTNGWGFVSMIRRWRSTSISARICPAISRPVTSRRNG